jgi:hypothetical protein
VEVGRELVAIEERELEVRMLVVQPPPVPLARLVWNMNSGNAGFVSCS